MYTTISQLLYDLDIKLIIFDIDGTLVNPQVSYKFNKKNPEQWQWLPDRIEDCAMLKRRGFKIGIATNQGGVAFNYCTEEQLWPEIKAIGEMIGADNIKVCYMHPKGFRSAYKGDSEDRKPNPGMLLKIMQELNIKPENTLMVGDMESDEEAAHNAHCQYCDASVFFEDLKWI